MLKRLLNEANGIIKTYTCTEASRKTNYEVLEAILEKEGIELKPYSELDQRDGADKACLVYLDDLSSEDKEILTLIANQGVNMFVVDEIASDFTAYITKYGIVITVMELEKEAYTDRLISIPLGKAVLQKVREPYEDTKEVHLEDFLDTRNSTIIVQGNRAVSELKRIEDKLKEQNNKIVYCTDCSWDDTEDVHIIGFEFRYLFRLEA